MVSPQCTCFGVGDGPICWGGSPSLNEGAVVITALLVLYLVFGIDEFYNI